MSALSESVYFRLGEELDLEGNEQIWTLRDGEIRFQGCYYPECISANDGQIKRFVEKLDSLDFWIWRDDYDTRDTEWDVLDGGCWTFQARVNDREWKASGWNAYPSLEDPLSTSVRIERYGQLVSAIQEIFGVKNKSFFSA